VFGSADLDGFGDKEDGGIVVKLEALPLFFEFHAGRTAFASDDMSVEG